MRTVLIMSTLQKKTEFYKWESDPEVIVMQLGVLESVLLQQPSFPIMGTLPFHQIFPLPMEVLLPEIVYPNRRYCNLK